MVFGQRTPNYLNQIKALKKPMKVYAHHHAHAACAFYGAGWDDGLVLTADGWGEDGSHTLYEGRRDRIPSLKRLACFVDAQFTRILLCEHHEGARPQAVPA